jgi:hypothetical protein
MGVAQEGLLGVFSQIERKRDTTRRYGRISDIRRGVLVAKAFGSKSGLVLPKSRHAFRARNDSG